MNDQLRMNSVKVHQHFVNEIQNRKMCSNPVSPLLSKKNFMANILPNMEKKKWTSTNIINDQVSLGKSDISKSEISKSVLNFTKDKEHSLDSNKENKQVVVIFDYKAENPDELQLEEGELVNVLDKNLIDDGWWKGIKTSGEIGIFPSNFVKPYQEHHSTTSLKKSLHDDTHIPKLNDNGSMCDQSNISSSISFNDLSYGGRPTLLMSPNKGKTSNISFKTKNVYANSCSMDSLSELTKSKKMQDQLIKPQNPIFKFRALTQHCDTSKGDEVSNSIERNLDSIKKLHSSTASPPINQGDYYLLKSEFERFKQEVDHKMSKLSIRIQTLIEEIDEEKKQRAASEIELVRLRRVVHMLDAQSSNGLF